jgi:hypothetical protein
MPGGPEPETRVVCHLGSRPAEDLESAPELGRRGLAKLARPLLHTTIDGFAPAERSSGSRIDEVQIPSDG